MLKTEGAIKRRDEKKEHRSVKPKKTPEQVKVTCKRKGALTNKYILFHHIKGKGQEN